ncbi:hypothetical protein V6N13_038386 [Hibiscus sabdariffa]|uniref:Disease resistance N-terminal domain-containing protein n=2 Tax=Hibiscus sabdariffa TaxID=183260 RepID=A0ABR1ZLS3_9ROSI
MADAIVSLAVERISDLLINEALFLKDVKEEVESLKAELERMQCFVEDVDCQLNKTSVSEIECQKSEILLSMLKMSSILLFLKQPMPMN